MSESWATWLLWLLFVENVVLAALGVLWLLRHRLRLWVTPDSGKIGIEYKGADETHSLSPERLASDDIQQRLDTILSMQTDVSRQLQRHGDQLKRLESRVAELRPATLPPPPTEIRRAPLASPARPAAPGLPPAAAAAPALKPTAPATRAPALARPDTPEALAPAAAEGRRALDPMPAIMRAPRMSDVMPAVSESAFLEQVVFFGTDRQKAPEPVHYGVDRSTLHLGQCVVTVPAHREIGKIARPGWLSGEDPEKHYVLQSVKEQTEANFLEDLRAAISRDPRKQALVFVHGFNVTFVDAVYRTAQIAADLKFPGAAAAFSWPSVKDLSKDGYLSDMDAADYAVQHLPAFLALLARRTGAEQVHVIAHSMGNRLLTRAIEKILSSLPDVRLTEVMLTAPDIDTDVFLNQIAPAIVGAARRTTLYVSSDDEALRLSGQWRPRPRAGDSSQQVVVAAGIDTVDVTAVSTGLVGHSYYGDNRSVLSDIFNVIKGQTPAERFGLEPRQAPGGQYWVFRP